MELNSFITISESLKKTGGQLTESLTESVRAGELNSNANFALGLMERQAKKEQPVIQESKQIPALGAYPIPN